MIRHARTLALYAIAAAFGLSLGYAAAQLPTLAGRAIARVIEVTR